MGSCFSGQKRSDAPVRRSQSEAAKANKMVMASEKYERVENREIGPIDEKGSHSSDLSSLRRSYAGSKDEAFFDSLAWLESDCDDDYVSVRGDFTPSTGNTFQGSPTVVTRPTLASIVSSMSDPKAIAVVRMSDSKPQVSPNGSKKRLEDLFRETKDNDNNTGDISTPLQSSASDQQKVNGEKLGVDEPNAGLSLKFLIASPSTPSEGASTGNGETTPNGTSSKLQSRKEAKSNRCCLPGLLPIFGFNDRKKLSTPIPANKTTA